MQLSARTRPVGKLVWLLAGLVMIAGVCGMALSLIFLASADARDVIAGAGGFVAGSILAASGLVSFAVVERIPRRLEPLADGPDFPFAPPLDIERWLAHFQRNLQYRPEPEWEVD